MTVADMGIAGGGGGCGCAEIVVTAAGAGGGDGGVGEVGVGEDAAASDFGDIEVASEDSEEPDDMAKVDITS